MAVFSFVVLLFVVLAGYSSGAALAGGKTREIRPRATDLVAILLLGGGAVYSRRAIALNRWLLVAIGLGVSHLLAIVIISFQKAKNGNSLGNVRPAGLTERRLKRLWNAWRSHSRKAGAFQSRVLLSLFYFIFLAPIGLIIKALSDPLNIKRPDRGLSDSHWLPRKAANGGNDDFKRQY